MEKEKNIPLKRKLNIISKWSNKPVSEIETLIKKRALENNRTEKSLIDNISRHADMCLKYNESKKI